MTAMAPELGRITAERVQAELGKLLLGAAPRAGLEPLSAIVLVGPPLKASGFSFGSVLFWSLDLCRSQLSSEATLKPSEENPPTFSSPQSEPPPSGSAMIELSTLT